MVYIRLLIYVTVGRWKVVRSTGVKERKHKMRKKRERKTGTNTSNLNKKYTLASFHLKQPRCPSADECIRKLWYIYTMEYYSAIKKNTFGSVLMRWIKLEPVIHSEISQKDKHQYSILMCIYGI